MANSRHLRKKRRPSVGYLLLFLLVSAVGGRDPIANEDTIRDDEPSIVAKWWNNYLGPSSIELNKKSWRVGGFINRGYLTSRWNRVEYRGEKIEDVVDMHLHTGRWEDLPESFQDSLLEQIPFPFNCRLLAAPFVNILLSAYAIAAQLICSRISKGVLFAVYAPETTGLTENKFVRDEIDKCPTKFYGLASLPVNDWDTNEKEALQLLRKFLKRDEFIGVKMGHPHMKINLNDRRYYSIYGVAEEFQKPVYIHLGLAATEGSLTNKEAIHPDFIEEAIQLYPNVQFILGHMGQKAFFDGLDDPFDACFRIASQYSNVWLEASAVGSDSNDPDGELLLRVYQGVKEFMLQKKIVYGSDGPQFPGFPQDYLENTLTAMERANYTVQEATLVLGDNFRELFGLNDWEK